MIPNEAVEAAANAISECSGMRFDGFWSRIEDLEPEDREYALTEARYALEAAAPYLPRTITTAEELDGLPVASVIRTDVGSIYVKDDIRGTERRSWWVTTDEQFDFETKDIDLPAQVLYVAEHNRAWPS